MFVLFRWLLSWPLPFALAIPLLDTVSGGLPYVAAITRRYVRQEGRLEVAAAPVESDHHGWAEEAAVLEVLDHVGIILALGLRYLCGFAY